MTVSPADHLQQIAARLDNWALDPGHPEIQAVYLHSLAWSIRAASNTECGGYWAPVAELDWYGVEPDWEALNQGSPLLTALT